MRIIPLEINLFAGESSSIVTSKKIYDAMGNFYGIIINVHYPVTASNISSILVDGKEVLNSSKLEIKDGEYSCDIYYPVYQNKEYIVETETSVRGFRDTITISGLKEKSQTKTLRKKNLTSILRGSVINSLDDETDEVNAPSIAAVNEKLKNLDVAAGDGVPTNSIVGFDGEASEVPEGYQVVDEDVIIYSDQVPIGTELDYYGTTVPAGYEQVEESSLPGNSVVKYLVSSQTISVATYTQVGEATITLNTTGGDIFISFGLCCSNPGGSPRIGILVDDEEKFGITDSLTAEHIESRSTLLRNIPAGSHTFKLAAHKGNATSITIPAYTSYHLSVFEI